MKKTSSRGEEWKEFSLMVLDHIENYTVPQYGDFPKDQATEWDIEQCADSIKRYCNRANSSVRPGEDVRDALKIAHYACMMHGKQLDQAAKNEVKRFDAFCHRIKCPQAGKDAGCMDRGCEAYMCNQQLEKREEI